MNNKQKIVTKEQFKEPILQVFINFAIKIK